MKFSLYLYSYCCFVGYRVQCWWHWSEFIQSHHGLETGRQFTVRGQYSICSRGRVQRVLYRPSPPDCRICLISAGWSAPCLTPCIASGIPHASMALSWCKTFSPGRGHAQQKLDPPEIVDWCAGAVGRQIFAFLFPADFVSCQPRFDCLFLSLCPLQPVILSETSWLEGRRPSELRMPRRFIPTQLLIGPKSLVL